MMTSSLAALVLALPLPSQQAQEPIRALVVTGANNHDWKWTAPQICAALQETGRFDVTLTQNPAADLKRAAALHAAGELDLIVLDYNGPRWGGPAERAFLAAVEAGCGVSVVHAANNAFPGWDEYERLVGLLWRRGTGHGRYHPFDVHVVDHHHPITTGLADLRAHPDELYHRLVHKEGAQYRVLMSAYSDPETGGTGRHEPMVTAGAYGAGRVFHTPLGHVWRNNVPSRATWADPQLRLLLARGSEWAATGVVTLDATPLNRVSKAEADEGFVALFDGKEITEWTAFRRDAVPSKGWVVRDAAIVHEKAGGGGDLVSRDVYGDFDFRFSFRVAKGANSGVMWHVTDAGQQTYFTGPEYQVLDDGALDPSDAHSVGALYDLVGPSGKSARPPGVWNDGRIVVHKGRLQHFLNGAKVVDCPCEGPEWQKMIAKSKFRDWPFGKAQRGRLALQDHGDEVAFRNLRVKKL